MALVHLTVAESTTTALLILSERKDDIDVVIVDNDMPNLDVLTLLWLAANMELLAILMSANVDDRMISRAIESGAFRMMEKPVTEEALNIYWNHHNLLHIPIPLLLLLLLVLVIAPVIITVIATTIIIIILIRGHEKINLPHEATRKGQSENERGPYGKLYHAQPFFLLQRHNLLFGQTNPPLFLGEISKEKYPAANIKWRDIFSTILAKVGSENDCDSSSKNN
ncbi:hypothetical protein RJ639_039307 [Escallonia herrerae]|uniref:Response regulatory domain-containing protein n=1 Tax=Escallonia herrerae TaxID=1293975 RepID=A0AA88WL51_9ASTE|nr:hypothetical protein RJ639_039307 [Escallonia herrerae]